ncbi:MAG: hypothetical protein GQ574_27835 [Crocinitomix sp.]|nr:hypothetical protein [Crocinitomix sp.]
MDKQKTNSDLIEPLTQAHLKYFDAEYIRENFVIPQLYTDSIDKLRIKELFDASLSIANTQWGIDVYGDDFLERKDANKLTKNDKIYVAIGEWGSNHLFLMCCDKSSNDFGKIFDYNDAHPWHGSHHWEVEWKDFNEFLKDEYDQ